MAFVLAALLLLTPAALAQGLIVTVAGGDRIFPRVTPALAATFDRPTAVALDAAGNVYLADSNYHVVVRYSLDGTVTLVAGNGIHTPGFSGDGGPATDASLNFPQSVALDTAGNLFIGDVNRRIRKVSPQGIITTVAGTGNCCYAGDGGLAINAAIGTPSGLAFDSLGNLYFSDKDSDHVRKIDPKGMITTVAGNGVEASSGDNGQAVNAALFNPSGVAFDTLGNLYISESGSHRVRKVSTAFAGTGLCGLSGDGQAATSGQLCTPEGVAADTFGNVYIADTGNGRVRRVASSGILTTVAGGGTALGDGQATSAAVGPRGVAVDAAGSLFIADNDKRRLRKVGALGMITTLAGTGAAPFFEGDGGPATRALLEAPRHMAFDREGNLYIADYSNSRIRKVTPQGLISTVAGNGQTTVSGDGGQAINAGLGRCWSVAMGPDNSLYIVGDRVRKVAPNGTISTIAGGGNSLGDNGPAVSARLLGPTGVAVDADGNVYINDFTDHRVRKINTAGIITTVAGTGVPGFSGDNGAASTAQIKGPSSVAVDSSGNLYISEFSGYRVRKVNTSGIITTVAGTGQAGRTGDGGAAINATVTAEGLAVDTAGNVYIADGNSWVRKIDTQGTITTLAGGPRKGFGGDGGLAANATLNGPWGLAVDAAGNIYIAENAGNRVRAILNRKSTYSVSPTTLSFSALAGSAGTPSQRLVLNGDPAGLFWQTDFVLVEPGVPAWLKVTPNTGPMPASVDVFASATNLLPGSYRGTIVFSALGTTATVTVSVTLNVTAAQPAGLAVTPSSLAFRALLGGTSPPAQTLRIENVGAGSLGWTARATAVGGSWLTIVPASGSVSGGAPALPQVNVSPAGLLAGSYSGTIAIQDNATGQTISVPVNLRVSAPAGELLLSQTGLLFRAVEAGGAEPSQTFGVLAIGTGSLDWTAETTAPWLRISPASGRSDAGSTQIPLVTVSVEPSRLTAGFYAGLIKIVSSGANNSPQVVRVDLQVLARGARLPAVVRPTGLIFAASAGGAPPGSQSVQVATPQTAAVEFLSQPIGGDWVTRTPDFGLTTRDIPGRIVVQADPANLPSGVYRAGITVFTRDDGEQYPVRLLFLVLSAGGVSAASLHQGSPATNCVATQLFLQFSTQFSSFQSAVGYPANLSVLARDSCGNPVERALVITAFSNGDPQLDLVDMKNGLYERSWRPSRLSSTPVVVQVRGSLGGLTGETQATVTLTPNPNLQGALLNQGGVLPAAGFESGPVAPGSIIAMFGQNIAAADNSASTIPLPRQLGGVRVTIGGQEAPLYYAGRSQVNAQVPVEITSDLQVQLLLETNGVTSAPEYLQTVATRPGIFTLGGPFGKQGAILLAGTDKLAMPSTTGISSEPALGGSVVSIYCSGLGATNPAVPSGQASSGSPLAFVKASPLVTIGGQPATVDFAGLAPGLVGVYQLNVRVPNGLALGNAVEVQIVQGGFRSNTATMAVR